MVRSPGGLGKSGLVLTTPVVTALLATPPDGEKKDDLGPDRSLGVAESRRMSSIGSCSDLDELWSKLHGLVRGMAHARSRRPCRAVWSQIAFLLADGWCRQRWGQHGAALETPSGLPLWASHLP